VLKEAGYSDPHIAELIRAGITRIPQ